ncbi:MAG: hypothetical protein ACRCTY_06855, partial [Candidatus Adiutrix sp.]
WGMPAYLQEVVLYHHRPDSATEHQLTVAVVHLALELVALTDFALTYEEPCPTPALGCLDLLKQLGPDEKNKLLEKMQNTLPLMAPSWLQMLGTSSPHPPK